MLHMNNCQNIYPMIIDSLPQASPDVVDVIDNGDLVQEILKAVTDYIGTSNTILIIILLVINIVATLCNIFIPIWLKNKEKKIYSFQVKEKTRISLHENIYSTMWVIKTNYLFPDNSHVINDAYECLRKTITLQSLYLDKKVITIINKFLDWHRKEEHDMKECDDIMNEFKDKVF